jgi:hypothetical protein
MFLQSVQILDSIEGPDIELLQKSCSNEKRCTYLRYHYK